MAIFTSVLALSGLISASYGELLDRAPAPGVVSLRYSLNPKQLSRRGGSVSLPFGAQYLDYVVNITAGTPPQPITLSLDTGSSDTILLQQESTYCHQLNGACPSVGFYNAKKSSTYKALPGTFTSNFGFQNQSQGSGATGTIATDSFAIAGAKLTDQQFLIAATNATIAESILGLGYAAGENQVFADPPQKPYDNFPLSLAKQGATNLALFSLYKTVANKFDGTVLFGGIDKGKYSGSLTTLETQNRTGVGLIAFDVLLNGLALSGDTAAPKAVTGSESAVLDCGTSYTILPDDWVDPIHKTFNVTYFAANDTAYVECALQNAPYTLNFTFQDLTIPVPMSSLVSLRAVNPDICTFDVVPAGSRHPLLGDNFLSNAYTVFDITNNQISIGLRDFSSTTEDIVAVPSGGVKSLGSQTVNPSGSPGTTTGSSPSPTATKKGGASSASAHVWVVGVSLFSALFIAWIL